MPSVFIIAEAGSNAEDSLDRALRLVDIAKWAGSDAVKFQLIRPFKPEWIDPLIEHCNKVGIEFMATPFNYLGIHALKGKVKRWKIASTEAANPEFIRFVFNAAGDDPVYLSDGAIDNYETIGIVGIGKNVIPMSCVIKYPAEETDYKFFTHPYENWGLSDHTTSTILAVLAVAKGAVAIEKHFTDDNTRPGPDHSYACNPQQLKEYINMIRHAETILNNDKKITITDYIGREIVWP